MGRAPDGRRAGIEPWRLACVAGCVLALVACGGAADDEDDRTAPPLPDEGNRVPGVFEFPAGGKSIAGAAGLTAVPYAIDRSGVLWFIGCGGVMAISDGQARVYDETNAPLPPFLSDVHVDAANRKWFTGAGPESALVVLEHGEFRTVLTAPDTLWVQSSASGVVWASHYEANLTAVVIRQVSPSVGEPLPMPTSAPGFYIPVTDHDGAVWLLEPKPTSAVGYRWLNGDWSEPFSIGGNNLGYDAEQDVLWNFADEDARDIRRVRWTGSGVEERIERGHPSADAFFAGFAPDGRQVWVDEGELAWVTDGVIRETHAAPLGVVGTQLSRNGSVYLVTNEAFYRQQGDARSELLNLRRFNGGCR
jgi:hypothetical protein